MASWDSNPAATCPAAAEPACDVASSAASTAMLTGSLDPDSPSSSAPPRPATSWRPRTEKSIAGSVGASAAPSSRALRQSSARTRCAAAATPAAVTRVPGTPIHSVGVATARSRRQPTRIPPSNRITARAADTMSSTAVNDKPPSRGQRSAAAAAANRKNAGAGMRRRSLSRLDSTAATPARAVISTDRPKVALIESVRLPGRGFPLAGTAGPPRCHRQLTAPVRRQRRLDGEQVETGSGPPSGLHHRHTGFPWPRH
jgi:hypothetical protein